MSRREKRELYEQLFHRKQSEGLSYQQLSRESGIPVRRLAWWCQKIAKERSEGEGFVEIVATEEAEPSGLEFEVVLRNDRRIHVPTGFDEQALGRLVALLESGC